MGILDSFRKKDTKETQEIKDELRKINHKINSLSNDLTTMKLQFNTMFKILRELNNKDKKT